jgi:hypothetical protein
VVVKGERGDLEEKSRAMWLNNGDENTKIFQAFANG